MTSHIFESFADTRNSINDLQLIYYWRKYETSLECGSQDEQRKSTITENNTFPQILNAEIHDTRCNNLKNITNIDKQVNILKC